MTLRPARVTRGLRPGARLRWSWRGTNLALLAVLALSYATGLGAVATGSVRGGWVVVAHGVVGVAVLALIPGKSRVVAGGLRRRRPGRWASVVLAVVVVGSLASGFASATGALRTVGGLDPLWLHIALALVAVLPLLWHVLIRPVRPRPRPADVGRRNLMRLGLLAAIGGGLYAGAEGVARLAGSRGAQRRFTGSHAVEPARMPVTSWIDDPVPDLRGADWRLDVTDADGPRRLSLDDLVADGPVSVRATLDCTSGWYATREWTGVPVGRLIRRVGPEHRSVRVRSRTGYDRYLPLTDLDGLLLATGYDGAPLAPGHGYPARLVAPGRRGFWWVKWVVGIELSRRPWWTQPPFPLT